MQHLTKKDRQRLDVPIETLRPHPHNARNGDLELIEESIRTHGLYRDIVVSSDDVVLAGNHTYMAAMAQGEKELPVTRVPFTHDSPQALAIMLMDNRANDAARYDEGLLAKLLENLPSLEGTGYTDQLLADLLARVEPTTGKTDPDDVPAPPKPEDAVTKPGDLWLLGNPRLLCGDSKTDLGRLVGEPADMVWTDPPYGVAIVGGSHALPEKERLARGGKTIKNDALDETKHRELLESVFRNCLALSKPGACWYVASPSGPLNLLFGTVLRDLGILRQVIVWVKDQFVMGRSDYHYRHEPIFYGWSPGAKHQEPPDRKQDSVWEIDRPRRSEEHPTMKPVELVERAIRNSSRASDRVLDPFGGSGTTLIASERSNRVALLCELDPTYCDVICHRFQEHTGLLPKREDGTEVSFTG